MTDQLISFKTAKLAKEKGFDWPCLHAISSKYSEDVHLAYDLTGETTFDLDDCSSAFVNTEDEHYLVPTQPLLQKWLREVHEVDIIVEPAEDDNGKYYCWRARIKMNSAKLGGVNGTFEKALEEGLQESLKSIKDERAKD